VRNARMAARRRSEAMDSAADARKRIEILQPLSVFFRRLDFPPARLFWRLVRYQLVMNPIGRLSITCLLPLRPERVAAIGRNGCGKTTLLSLITDKLKPWAGTVRVSTEYAMLESACDDRHKLANGKSVASPVDRVADLPETMIPDPAFEK
jgi:ATPase subunit of ABC transporter with duplicated ATPase domains